MEEGLRNIVGVLKATIPPAKCIWCPGYDNHESGTCRMGNDPATSIVNRYGQVHGISGLYVGASSIQEIIADVSEEIRAKR
ncbi:GMC oxidoreductase [Paenibacillus sp. NEAU-GSW1]|uniref:GMC oxidoreductase n=1 Tax=Paenibacillus sp. NEAU-GSW1 TaxID=2682486 RepID=UPI0012E1CF57|nr:hypothetical protein [Paenibacillus sp. NEAU-GSW1]